MPEPTTAPVRIVRWTTDGEPNVHVGDEVLDQGEMCTVEDVYVEGLGNGSPWMHVSLRDPRAANTGLPVHAAEFSGASLVAVRSAALAVDPGDLPARMAARLERACSHFADDPECAEMTAAAAMSVRWEDAAGLAAENARLRAALEESQGNTSAYHEHMVAAQGERDRHRAGMEAASRRAVAPEAGGLAVAACGGMAVIPGETLGDATDALREGRTADLPDGLCPICVSVAAGRQPEPPGMRGVCRECSTHSSHGDLCALCRQDAHDEWWATCEEARTDA